MSVQITEVSISEAASVIEKKFDYNLKLIVTKNNYKCELNKKLLEFMAMQVISANNIEINESGCLCLKSTFSFSQKCSTPAYINNSILTGAVLNESITDGNSQDLIYQ